MLASTPPNDTARLTLAVLAQSNERTALLAKANRSVNRRDTSLTSAEESLEFVHVVDACASSSGVLAVDRVDHQATRT